MLDLIREKGSIEQEISKHRPISFHVDHLVIQNHTGSFEIRPVAWHSEYVEQCPPNNADAFGLYMKQRTGQSLWIADFKTHKAAVRAAKAIADPNAEPSTLIDDRSCYQ